VCPGERIVFSGVGKTAEEMRLALEGGIRQFNVESEPELEVLSAVASSMGKTAPITVRVNPDVDARTHEKIATGKSENKFGIPIAHAREVYARAAALPGIEVIGIDVHIGSQLTDLEPFEIAYTKVADLTRQLRGDGHDIRRLDLGGGSRHSLRAVEHRAAPAAGIRRGHPAHRRRSGRRGGDRARAPDLRQCGASGQRRHLRQTRAMAGIS
jgi:diaminopimelate decarboxylase